MHTELTIYRCRCSKCPHVWNTKTHDLPTRCPQCKRVTWNDDQPQQSPKPVETKEVIPSLTIPYVAVKEATQEEWRFTKDKPDHNEDGRTYRSQYLVEDPRKRRMVRVDDDDHDVII